MSESVVRRDGTVSKFNAGDAVAATVDELRAQGIPLSRQTRGRLGKQAKMLFEDGFQPNVIVAAMVVAVRTGWRGSVSSIAEDMMLAQAGLLIGRDGYRDELAKAQRRLNPAGWESLLDDELAKRREIREGS